MRKPLDGVRVIELADYVSGPVCCRFLADMGAEVIKIERNSGNVWRGTSISVCPDRFSMEENPGYDIYNTGKKHIVLNLKTPEGMQICHNLLASADVFVTNTRVKALQRLGLDYETIKERYPKLVYAIGLGYGEKGPDADKPAFDHTAFWARTGFLLDMAVISDGYNPVFPPSSMGDTFTGMTLAAEVCAALLNREKTGKGDYVKSSLFHNGIFAMGAMQIRTQKPFGTVYPRNRAEIGVAFGDFRCKDGNYIYIASGYAEQLIPRVFQAIGKPEMIQDERFNTAANRKENCYLLYDILKEAILTKDMNEWLDIGNELDIPIIQMQHFSDLSEDEQAWANGYVEHVTFANGHTDIMPSSPFEMDSVGPLKTVPSHAIGEDTESVLKECGYTDDDLSALRSRGVIN